MVAFPRRCQTLQGWLFVNIICVISALDLPHGSSFEAVGLARGRFAANIVTGIASRKSELWRIQPASYVEPLGRGRKHVPPLCTLLGPGTFISGLHAANKALICWCSDPKHRDTVVKVADVGFLGLLGSLSLAAAWSPANSLTSVQPLILQMGFSHILLEMLFNGIAIPAMCASVVDERELHHPEILARSHRQEILEKAAARNVAKNKTGLRPDIWIHHILALTCFWVVLAWGEFHEEATMLTSVECTCALPVAFGQAAKAKQLKGLRSGLLGVLMCAGFVLRVALTAKLTIPRVVELAKAALGKPGVVESVKSVSGKAMQGSILEPQRVVLIVGSFGLTSLNVIWLCKILGGVWKVLVRATHPKKQDKAGQKDDEGKPAARSQSTDSL